MKMSEKLQEIKKDNKGFSLVELIIVIAIMAILIGIVGMNVIPQIENARKATDSQVISAMVSEAMEVYTQVAQASGKYTLTFNIGTDGSVSDATCAAVSGGGGDATTAGKIQNAFNELAGSNRVLKSNSGKGLGAGGIVITCDDDGVRVGTDGSLDGFDGYEFESR